MEKIDLDLEDTEEIPPRRIRRLKQLDLLPLEYKFKLTDLHDIVYNISTIHLPDYIVQADNNDIAANNSRLKQYSNPPL